MKRELDEIKATYLLEPTLRDVYVEGANEVYILRWFFDEKKIGDVHVYPVDLVEVPDGAFERLDLSKGSNHNKVIVLAEELHRWFKEAEIKVKCIADAEYDRHLGKCRRNYILEYTDYTSTEMYFFNKRFLKKFVSLVLHGFPASPSVIMGNWKRVLQRIFLIRLANESLQWGMKWMKPGTFKGYFSWSEGQVEFEEERFVSNYLVGNGRGREIEHFKEVMADFEQRLEADPRHNIRGHDFTYLFFLAVKRHRGHRCGFRDVETFERALGGCLELDFVEGELLFTKLGA
jgi:hypothetical protein